MDLGWCPVCDTQLFVIENLYCSEACRKKDALSNLNEECSYEFPRCSSRKPYQSPLNSPFTSPFTSPYNSPESSPRLYPYNTDYSFQLTSIISSSPSDLLLYGMTPSKSIASRNSFFNNTVDSSIMKERKVSKKKKFLN